MRLLLGRLLGNKCTIGIIRKISWSNQCKGARTPPWPIAFGRAFADHASEDREHAAKDGTAKLHAIHVVQFALVGSLLHLTIAHSIALEVITLEHQLKTTRIKRT